MIHYLFEHMKEVENFYPESHLAILRSGGYQVELSDNYSPIGQYVIHSMGKYWMAITDGTLEPFIPEQKWFLRVISGEEAPKYEAVKDWLRFLDEYPSFVND